MRSPCAFAVAVLALAGPLSAQTAAYGACGGLEPGTRAPSRDLYCIELYPRATVDSASGMAEMGRVVSPFSVSVTPDGRPRTRLILTLAGLPPSSALGAFTTYIAWAMPPGLDPVVKLGEVRNGRNTLGAIDFNKFFVMVSAETSAEVATRTGPLVLRGLSPSMRARAEGAFPLGVGDGAGGHARDMDMRNGWPMPVEDPRIPPMPAGPLHEMTPRATPFMPGHGVDPATIPVASAHRLVDVSDGDTLRLEAGLVKKTVRGKTFIAYAFNGQVPGPLVRVSQNATIVVDFTNSIDLPTTVHWHGIRLDNASDGVPHVTQEPVEPGGTYRYRVRFPDAGIYWYHPHVREDIQQDMGLYGNILVASPRADYYGPANREEVLILDDLLMGDDGPVPYGLESATHAVMGRSGNVVLVNGEPSWSIDVDRGEVVRLELTNASNMRTFNVSLPGARMKLVASDVGRFEREAWVESVVIAPAERYVVDVRFDSAGPVPFVNRVQALDHTYGNFIALADTLGVVRVSEAMASPDHARAFDTLRDVADVRAEIEALRPRFAGPPEKQLVLVLENRDLPFALAQRLKVDANFFNPVEWLGSMPMMDWLATGEEVRWVLRDAATGLENEKIIWKFSRGDIVRVRLQNERDAIHAMQHPIHIHGQRFLVLAVNGVPNDNLAWKDTVLVPAGATVDILLEVTNPGTWMLHCHIAEHLETGMHMMFVVE